MIAIKRRGLTQRRLNPILSKDDVGVLFFLWKHRIATFAALRSIFYPKVSGKRAYYLLSRLKQGDFVSVDKMDGTRQFVWCLAPRGFKYLCANVLPELRAKTYRPQSPYHDLMVASALLGRWQLKPPEDVSIISEQELSTTELTILPYELRKNMERKPDGLWIFNSGKEKFAIALEVETSGKSSERYEQICAFYTSQLFFRYVVWIVATKTLGRRILECSRAHGIPRDGLNLFIEQKDFVENEWNSKILNESMKGRTLGNLLTEQVSTSIDKNMESERDIDETLKGPNLEQVTQNEFMNFSINLEILETLRKKSAAKKL